APGLGAHPTPAAQPVQLSEKEMEALKDVEAEYETFLKVGADHDKRMREMAKREFDARTAELEKRYAERIAKTEADKAKHHAEAMALLEKFIQDHPNHQEFTPDAMFRLAQLYLDQADEDVDKANDALAASGGAQAGQPAPIADYTKATNLWETILKQFPSYRQ